MTLTIARQAFAFVFRDYHLTRRYLSWVIVFTAYSFLGAVTIALIGVAADDEKLTITLVLGALMWNFLSVMFDGIANAISYERWEGTLEYTFMAPVSRLIHLFGVSLWAALYTLVQTLIVLGGLLLFVDLDLSGANLGGVLVVLLVGSVAFTGLGLMAATLPVMSPEHGAQATNIFQALLLLVSGIYYPVSVLPSWIQPFSHLSPATYVLSASRKLIGLEDASGTSLTDVGPELLILVTMGVVLVPLGLWIFGRIEAWAKRTGKLKRTG